MLEFVTACLLLIITPGPGVLSVAGVGSGFGLKAGSRYLWGLCLGNNMVALLVISGIAATIFSVPYLREALLVISLGYLLYLALKIAFAGSKVGFITAETAPGMRDGILLQAVNPKAYVANTVLFTGWGFMPDAFATEAAIKLLLWNATWIPIHFGWLLLGIGLKKLDLPPMIQRSINIFMAVSMVLLIALALSNEGISLSGAPATAE